MGLRDKFKPLRNVQTPASGQKENQYNGHDFCGKNSKK